MTKIKKELKSVGSISKSKKLLKKGSEKKKLKKLKGLVESSKITSNADLVKKRVPGSQKSKTKKAKVSEYLDPEICNNLNISTVDVINAIKCIVKFRAENPKLQNQLFEEAAPIFLQISCHKVPRGIPKICRIPLQHSLYSLDQEICLIVSEIKGIRNIDYEKHIEYYEKLFNDKGIENIKKIMTFHEFRTEYETFEQKRRLVDLFDVFLADSKIAGKVVGKCGKIFYTKRKVPTTVKLQASKLKEHLDKVLHKTFLNLNLDGNHNTVQFGHTNMQERQLVENFSSVLKYLGKEFPGGFDNIQGLLIAAPRASSIPVYLSTKSANDLKVPKLVVKQPKAFKTYEGELTTLPNATVVVKPTGEVIVKRENKKSHKNKQGRENGTAGKYVRLRTEDKQKSKRKSIKKIK